jgi:HSP20 family protein
VKITFYNKDNNDTLSYDYLFRILFNLGGSSSSGILPRRSAFFDAFTLFRDIEYMDRAKNRTFDEFNDLSANASKDSIREHEIQDDGKMGKVNSFVYGYSIIIGPDGKPHVKEFGNVKPKVVTEDKATNIQYSLNKSDISLDRELLFDVTSTDKEVKVLLEIPGIKEEDIKINAFDGKIEVKTTNNSSKTFHKTLPLPKEAKVKTTRFTYNNGILEITFDKKYDVKLKLIEGLTHLRNKCSFLYNTFKSLSNRD